MKITITKKGSGQTLVEQKDPAFGPYYKVTENCPYLIEVEEGRLENTPAKLVKDGLYELCFRNFVGWSRVGDLLLKVRTPKLDETAFDAMLNQITEVCASLPFSFNRPSFLPFERIAPGGEDVLYHAFMYLRYAMKDAEPDLPSLIEHIVANPHRVLTQDEERREIHRARRLRPAAVNKLVSCPRDLMPTDCAPHLERYEIAGRLADLSGKRHFPTHVRCVRKEVSADNPENRFVKYFLFNCLSLAQLFQDYLQRKSGEGEAVDYNLVADSAWMVNRLEELLSRRFFAEVGEMAYLPYNSQVLQRGAGYREVFSHFNHMNQGSAYPIDSADLKKLIENKDVALLYEYWTYFVCIDAVKSVLGTPESAAVTYSSSEESAMEEGIKVDFAGGISLFYNKTYKAGSYSLPYRPDISLETPRGIYLFDAKFKIDKIHEQLREEGSAETQEEEFSQGFKYGDINKMHCYRDAIKGARAAFILYPGNISRFYHRTAGKSYSLDDFEDLDGVGAVPLRPSEKGLEHADGASELVKLMEKLLKGNPLKTPAA